VAELSFNVWRQFKSPLRVVVAFLLRSRERLVNKYWKLREDYDRTRREIVKLTGQCAALEAAVRESTAQARRLECELEACRREAARTLPVDPPVGRHGYGVRMVELSTRLAQVVGFRPATNVMKIFFTWMGVEQRVPHPTTIRNWMQRLGVAVMEEPLEQANDWVWMADHSNQIGQEKILVVLAIRSSQMPPPGRALRMGDMRVLAVRPGKSWKREDVARAYTELAKVHGVPRQILSGKSQPLSCGLEATETHATGIATMAYG
jgi:hypothetical protein